MLGVRTLGSQGARVRLSILHVQDQSSDSFHADLQVSARQMESISNRGDGVLWKTGVNRGPIHTIIELKDGVVCECVCVCMGEALDDWQVWIQAIWAARL